MLLCLGVKAVVGYYYYYYYYYYHTIVHTKCIQQTINGLDSCYIVNNSCNVQLIQVKNARKAQIVVCQFQQFRHKTDSGAFTNRESTVIISCEKTLRNHTLPKIILQIDQLNNLQTVPYTNFYKSLSYIVQS